MLGSLGSKVRRRGDDRFDDRNRDLRDRARIEAPLEFRRRVDQYKKGVAKNRNDE